MGQGKQVAQGPGTTVLELGLLVDGRSSQQPPADGSRPVANFRQRPPQPGCRTVRDGDAPCPSFPLPEGAIASFSRRRSTSQDLSFSGPLLESVKNRLLNVDPL